MADHDDIPPLALSDDPAGFRAAPEDTPAPVSVPALVDPMPTVPAPQRLRRRRRWPWILFLVVVLVVAVASRWNLNYYALQPGTAQSVQQFITVPADRNHPVSHPVLLTDVEIGRVTALSYLYFKLQGNSALEPVADVTGGTPPSELDAQGALEMSQAEDSAKAAALSRLGYQVKATPSGAVIFGTYPGTPAYGVLTVGDVVTAVDGMPVTTAADLVTVLSRYHSGETVTLTVRKGGTAAPVPEALTLRATEVDVGGGEMAKLDLGIQPEDQIDFTYPFAVSINVTNIGGPSAGLAMTLGVIDALTSGSVTGGRTVAATGTIDASGDVGDVGGVPQKTVAVENAGASIFLVPPQEYKAALSKDRPGLEIYAVSTLNQALAVLAAHGGSVPPVPRTLSTTAHPG
jgi:PDZ domain-containing protein